MPAQNAGRFDFGRVSFRAEHSSERASSCSLCCLRFCGFGTIATHHCGQTMDGAGLALTRQRPQIDHRATRNTDSPRNDLICARVLRIPACVLQIHAYHNDAVTIVSDVDAHRQHTLTNNKHLYASPMPVMLIAVRTGCWLAGCWRVLAIIDHRRCHRRFRG